MKVLFFKASWCSACHAIEEYVPADIELIDCDEDQETPVKYNVASLPIFIAIDDNGNEIARLKTTSIPALERWRKQLEEEHG